MARRSTAKRDNSGSSQYDKTFVPRRKEWYDSEDLNEPMPVTTQPAQLYDRGYKLGYKDGSVGNLNQAALYISEVKMGYEMGYADATGDLDKPF
jgi:hypothetical protein